MAAVTRSSPKMLSKGVEPVSPLLEVESLYVELPGRQGPVRPVAGVGFSLQRGETFALLGESGCGKSMTALAISRLLPPGGAIAAGEIRFEGVSLPDLPEAGMRQVRGGGIGMIFQEPATSLNPVLSVHTQIAEVLAQHRGMAGPPATEDRKSTRLNSSHHSISYAVFCLKKKK